MRFVEGSPVKVDIKHTLGSSGYIKMTGTELEATFELVCSNVGCGHREEFTLTTDIGSLHSQRDLHFCVEQMIVQKFRGRRAHQECPSCGVISGLPGPDATLLDEAITDEAWPKLVQPKML